MFGRTRLTRFERLTLPHMDAAYSLARWLTGGAQEAEDVVQEAYLRAFKSFSTFSGENAAGWLLTIVRHVSYDSLRERRSNVVAFDEALHGLEMESAPLSPEAACAAACESERVRRAIGSLPASFREALVLRDIEGLSYREIAAIAGVPVGTVMSRLSRGRARLKALLVAGEGRRRHDV